MMKGPYPLNSKNVSENVENGSTGVFRLYRSKGGPARFVGKSKDVARRLRDYADEYSHFEVETQDTITEAYKREAGLYHYHGDDQLDNPRHPARPHKQIKCPNCSIHD